MTQLTHPLLLCVGRECGDTLNAVTFVPGHCVSVSLLLLPLMAAAAAVSPRQLLGQLLCCCVAAHTAMLPRVLIDSED